MPRLLLRCASPALLVVAVLVQTGCGGETARPDGGPAPPADPAAETPAEGSAGGGTDPAAAVDPGSPAAAAAVVRDYYAAVAAGDHERAYGLWSGGGEASGQTFAGFRDGYAETASVGAEVGEPGRVEGAAGSRYVTVPVEVRATTTAGEQGCYRGAYTLRRAVVPGATEEQRRWRLAGADLAPCPADGAAGGAAEVPAAARQVVERLGERLAEVSLTAPPDRARAAIEEHYAPLVTPSLLEAWVADPAAAPGRRVSSPWPERIEVAGARLLGDDRVEVAGEVVYVTSVELAAGGAARREPLEADVVRDAAGDWRIDGWRQGAPEPAEP